jgi:hypothetical protein
MHVVLKYKWNIYIVIEWCDNFGIVFLFCVLGFASCEIEKLGYFPVTVSVNRFKFFYKFILYGYGWDRLWMCVT